jgi:hypothetical protein
MLLHCAHTLCSYTVLIHCAHTLRSCTILIHYARTLCSHTTLIHYVHTLRSCTILIHYVPVTSGGGRVRKLWWICCSSDTNLRGRNRSRQCHRYSTHSTHTELIQYTHFAHTHTVLIVHTVLILCSYSTHTLLIPCTHIHCTPPKSRSAESSTFSRIGWRISVIGWCISPPGTPQEY